jgi:hypothetical protein
MIAAPPRRKKSISAHAFARYAVIGGDDVNAFAVNPWCRSFLNRGETVGDCFQAAETVWRLG